MTAIPPLPAGVEDDPEIRNKAKQIILAAYDLVLELIEDGDPTTQIQLVRALLPTMNRALRDRADDEEMVALRSKVDEAYGGIRKAIGVPGA